MQACTSAIYFILSIRKNGCLEEILNNLKTIATHLFFGVPYIQIGVSAAKYMSFWWSPWHEKIEEPLILKAFAESASGLNRLIQYAHKVFHWFYIPVDLCSSAIILAVSDVVCAVLYLPMNSPATCCSVI